MLKEVSPVDPLSNARGRAPAGAKATCISSSKPARDGEESYPALGTILKVALVAVGAAGIAGWLLLALVHVGDRYMVGHVQGIWMALARYATKERSTRRSSTADGSAEPAGCRCRSS